MDRFLVHGDKYKALRDAVGKAFLECSPRAAATALEVGRAPACPLGRVAPLATRIFPPLCQITQWEGSQGVTPCVRSHARPSPQSSSSCWASRTRRSCRISRSSLLRLCPSLRDPVEIPSARITPCEVCGHNQQHAPLCALPILCACYPVCVHFRKDGDFRISSLRCSGLAFWKRGNRTSYSARSLQDQQGRQGDQRVALQRGR